MKRLLFVLISLTMFATNSLGQEAPSKGPKNFAVAEHPTPVFSTPDFAAIFGGSDGNTLKTDECGQIRELEFIALPKTVFKVVDRITKGKITVFKVTADDYPNPPAAGLFIDSRFVSTQEKEPRARSRALLKKPTIVENLVSLEGKMYTWGGNYSDGVHKLYSLYPPANEAKLSPETKERWMLKGLDCSGLLYEATNGYTPRNTNALIEIGRPVLIAGLKAADIVKKVEPLDLIAWQGHVIIILDKERAIESRLDKKKNECGGGVKVRPLMDVLNEVVSSRAPSDKSSEAKSGRKFVIRRWYPESQF